MWKLADFGLTSEGTSNDAQKTQHARGTGGYRAPELLVEDAAVYSKKTDIWTLGCILHELATNSKLFFSDFATHEYYSRNALTLSVNQILLSDTKRAIESCIQEMIQIDPGSRPDAEAQVECFTRHLESCQRLKQQEEIQSETGSQQSTAINHREEASSTPASWTVIYAVINKSNTRLATAALNEDQTTLFVKLWDTASESVLWENQKSWYTYSPEPYPSFSEEGNYLGVYIQPKLYIVETVSGKDSNTCTLPGELRNPRALGILQDGRRFAICFRSSKASVIEEIYSRNFVDENELRRVVDVVKADVSDVALLYVSQGRRLYMVGQRDQGGALISCWDPQMPNGFRHVIVDDCRPLVEPLYPIRINNTIYVAINPIYSVQQRSVNRLMFVSATAEIERYWQANAMVLGFVRDGILIFKKGGSFTKSQQGSAPLSQRLPSHSEERLDRYYLWKWSCKTQKMEWTRHIGDHLPSIDEVKGLMEVANGVKLILEDGRFFCIEYSSMKLVGEDSTVASVRKKESLRI